MLQTVSQHSFCIFAATAAAVEFTYRLRALSPQPMPMQLPEHDCCWYLGYCWLCVCPANDKLPADIGSLEVVVVTAVAVAVVVLLVVVACKLSQTVENGICRICSPSLGRLLLVLLVNDAV